MNGKTELSGVPETMLQTVYARAGKVAGVGPFATGKRKRSLTVWIMIFLLRRRIQPCAAVSLPARSCWIG